jgi:cytochrome P450
MALEPIILPSGVSSRKSGFDALPARPWGALRHIAAFVRDPHGFHRRMFADGNDVFIWHGFDCDIAVTSNPEHARGIFAADPAGFETLGAKEMAPMVGARSLLLLSGEPHKRERKLMAPPFHGARMRAYGQGMQEIAEGVVSRLTRGAVVKIQDVMQEISLKVILRTVLGLLASEETALAQKRFEDLFAATTPIILYIPFLQRELGGFGPWARFLRVRRALDEMLFAHIRRRRAQAGGDDILKLLISARYEDGAEVSDAQVRDQLLTLLFAGHETTAQGMSWLYYFVHNRPEILARLRTELESLGPNPDPEEIAAQPYLEAVCQESLRIKPILPGVYRTLRQPHEMGGYKIPAGQGVAVSVYGVHHRKELYPDALVFRPERFIERRFAPYEYIPFGGGHRRCLGAAFALYEMKQITYALLRQFDFRQITHETPQVVSRNLSLGPHNGIPMMYSGRRG